jgi:hypothetical protein
MVPHRRLKMRPAVRRERKESMIQRALVAIAGVDRNTLKTCPATAKVRSVLDCLTACVTVAPRVRKRCRALVANIC